MADNRKYYYLKLKEDFFDTDEMKILESMKDGYLYSNILLKLYLKSLSNSGREKYRLCVREGVQHHRQQVFIRKAVDPHYEYDIEGYAGVRGHPIQTYL